MKKIGLVLICIFQLYGESIDVCISCHGKNFEKKAFAKSKIVKDMSQEDIINALKGYKNGSYGGLMKKLMKVQVSNFNDDDIEAISYEIKNGKKPPKKKIVKIDGLIYQNQSFEKKYNWKEAKQYCSEMSLNNYTWRLPKKNELMKLITKKLNRGEKGQFYIRKKFVDNLKGFAWFWSITEKNITSAVIVNFYNGVYNIGEKELKGYVLCVSEGLESDETNQSQIK